MDEQEYLNLFRQTPPEPAINPWQNLNEKPNTQQWGQSINETPDVSQYQIPENLNDGWGNLDIQIEARVNGVPMSQNPYYNPQTKRAKRIQEDLNGLGQYLDDENVNEVYQAPKTMMSQPLEPEVTQGPTLNIREAEVVTVEMFERVNQRAFMDLTSTKGYYDLRQINS